MDSVDEVQRLQHWATQKRRVRAALPSVEDPDPEPSTRRLLDALSEARPLAVIAEPARCSPDEGHLRDSLDLGEFACACARAGVGALALPSDLRFGISANEWGDLVDARLALPVLHHDLVVDPGQIAESRRLGADAVWLHLEILDDARIRRCLERARALNMDVVAEAWTPEQIARAIDAGAKILCTSAFDEMGAQNEDAALELLRLAPREILRVVRGPVSGAAGLLPLRSEVDALWICGPASMPRDTFAYLQPLVAEARAH